MSNLNDAKQVILGARPYRTGAVKGFGEKAVLDAIADAEANGLGKQPVPSWVRKTSVDETAQTVKTGAGRVYGIRVESPSGANDDCIVRLLDNSVVIGTTKCAQTKAAEAYHFAGAVGVGIPFATNLQVTAVKADGSSALDTADEPTVYVLVG